MLVHTATKIVALEIVSHPSGPTEIALLQLSFNAKKAHDFSIPPNALISQSSLSFTGKETMCFDFFKRELSILLCKVII